MRIFGRLARAGQIGSGRSIVLATTVAVVGMIVDSCGPLALWRDLLEERISRWLNHMLLLLIQSI